MQFSSLTVAAAALLVATVASAQTSTDRALAADVDSLVQRIMSVSDIPGVSIAVVSGSRPILLKGYGFADIERRIPVTENTAFYIASITKAFTAMTVLRMADRKMLELDAPITRYLTDAQWSPEVHPESITVRQLLTHTSGINGDGPVIWRTAFTGQQTNPMLKQLLRLHGASASGHNYRYTNLGYNIAGLIIDDLTRGKWQDALTREVLAPVGMSNTTAYVSRVDSARRAMPYVMEPAGPRRVHYAKSDANMQAAGGLVSTAADMAKWLEAQLNQGRVGGRQVLPAPLVAEAQRRQVPAAERRGELQAVGYALGWMVVLLGSDTVLIHGGGFSSFHAVLALDLKRHVGVAVMGNESKVGSGAVEFIAQYVLEHARDADATRLRYAQRVTELPALVERIKGRIGEDLSRRAARPQTLSKPLEAYAGTYESPEWGVMTWTVRDGRLWAEIGALKSVAEVFDNQADQLRVELEPGSGQIVQFKFTDGRASSIVHSNHEYARRP